jgi:hypothetical protein
VSIVVSLGDGLPISAEVEPAPGHRVQILAQKAPSWNEEDWKAHLDELFAAAEVHADGCLAERSLAVMVLRMAVEALRVAGAWERIEEDRGKILDRVIRAGYSGGWLKTLLEETLSRVEPDILSLLDRHAAGQSGDPDRLQISERILRARSETMREVHAALLADIERLNPSSEDAGLPARLPLPELLEASGRVLWKLLRAEFVGRQD